MPFDPNLLFTAINFDSPNLDLIKSAVIEGVYIDSAGYRWNVTSPDIESVKALVCPVDNRGYSTNVNTKNYNASCSCFGLFWLRKRDFVDFSIEFMFNDAIITFSHGHDLQTRVATRHGKPSDLSKYTKDRFRPTATATLTLT